jgi:periplasmic copper chaperone A
MTKAVPILAALLLLAGCGGEGPPSPRAGPAATVRLPAVPGRPAAGYFALRIAGDRGALVSVGSPQAARVEMHETMQHGTMSEMRPIARVPVRDGEMLAFAPGGRHLMIYDLDRSVPAGGNVRLVLEFERGDPVTLDARLVPTGGDI